MSISPLRVLLKDQRLIEWRSLPYMFLRKKERKTLCRQYTIFQYWMRRPIWWYCRIRLGWIYPRTRSLDQSEENFVISFYNNALQFYSNNKEIRYDIRIRDFLNNWDKVERFRPYDIDCLTIFSVYILLYVNSYEGSIS